MLRQQDIKCERYVAVVIDIIICVCQDMLACADLPMVEKLETFLTISDDDDGNFTKCCHAGTLLVVRRLACLKDSGSYTGGG